MIDLSGSYWLVGPQSRRHISCTQHMQNCTDTIRTSKLIGEAGCYSVTPSCHLLKKKKKDVGCFCLSKQFLNHHTGSSMFHTYAQWLLDHWQMLYLAVWRVAAHSLQDLKVRGQSIHFPTALNDPKLCSSSKSRKYNYAPHISFCSFTIDVVSYNCIFWIRSHWLILIWHFWCANCIKVRTLFSYRTTVQR